MPKRSAGILLFRRTGTEPEFLLVHPGGPFWTRKDDLSWSIPKGLYEPTEDPLVAARREFEEETGHVPAGACLPLGDFRQPGGKLVSAWAVEGDFDPATLRSNLFSMEWPPRTSRIQEFPEVDRAAWFTKAEAERKLLRGQWPIVETLCRILAASAP